MTKLTKIKLPRLPELENIYEKTYDFDSPLGLRRRYSKSHISIYNHEDGNIFGGENSCKEQIINKLRQAFCTNKKYFNVGLLIKIHPTYVRAMISAIHDFEKKVMKLNKLSVFFDVENTKYGTYMVVARRWTRCPMSMYILLSLIKLSCKMDENKSLSENIEEIRKMPWSLPHDGNICIATQQLSWCYEFFRDILDNRFNESFSSSKYFKENWELPDSKSKPSPYYSFSADGRGPTSFITISLQVLENQNNKESSFSKDSYIIKYREKFKGLSDLLLDKYLPLKNKANEPQQAINTN